jgi:hypothetical protein
MMVLLPLYLILYFPPIPSGPYTLQSCPFLQHEILFIAFIKLNTNVYCNKGHSNSSSTFMCSLHYVHTVVFCDVVQYSLVDKYKLKEPASSTFRGKVSDTVGSSKMTGAYLPHCTVSPHRTLSFNTHHCENFKSDIQI